MKPEDLQAEDAASADETDELTREYESFLLQQMTELMPRKPTLFYTIYPVRQANLPPETLFKINISFNATINRCYHQDNPRHETPIVLSIVERQLSHRHLHAVVSCDNPDLYLKLFDRIAQSKFTKSKTRFSVHREAIYELKHLNRYLTKSATTYKITRDDFDYHFSTDRRFQQSN